MRRLEVDSRNVSSARLQKGLENTFWIAEFSNSCERTTISQEGDNLLLDLMNEYLAFKFSDVLTERVINLLSRSVPERSRRY